MCHTYTVIFFIVLFVKVQKGQDLSSNNEKKLSVVLFLAKTSTTEAYKEDSGIKFLNFVEKTRVKHCAPDSNEDYSSANDCKQLLKSSLFALISFCRNVMGMTTAIASVQNDSFSNGLRFRRTTSEDLEVRYHYPRSISGRTDSIPNLSDFISTPEHSEVFKIRTKHLRSKRQLPLPEAPTLEEKNDVSPKWTIFRVVANIQLIFFGRLLGKTEGKEAYPQENGVINNLGQTSRNELFDLVKETLANLQDSGDAAFLMIVLGGSLFEISDIFSPLMQSIKHVVETTDEKNTLIVLTGSCPPIDSLNAQTNEANIPVYVKVPPMSVALSILDELYDVPYSIKNLLTDLNGGTFFTGVKAKRNKRHLFKVHPSGNNQNHISASPLVSILCILVVLSCK